MDEQTFQSRLRYTAFKQIMIVVEAILFIFLLTLSIVLGIPQPWFRALIAFQLMRVGAAIANHYHVATFFNVQDRWMLFPLI